MATYESNGTRVALGLGPENKGPETGKFACDTTATKVDLPHDPSPLDLPAKSGTFETNATKVDLDRTPQRGVEGYPMSRRG